MSEQKSRADRQLRFWIPWVTAAAVTAITIFFFLVGVADGSVSSFNAGMWALLLAFTVGVTIGSLFLKVKGRPGLGAVLALVLAVPGVIALLFFLLVLISEPRWN